MTVPDPVTQHEVYGRQLRGILEQALTGELTSDQAAMERQIVRLLGALVRLQQRHRVDGRSRCPFCRSPARVRWWPWPKRISCTVHDVVGFFLRQPDWAVHEIMSRTGAAEPWS